MKLAENTGLEMIDEGRNFGARAGILGSLAATCGQCRVLPFERGFGIAYFSVDHTRHCKEPWNNDPAKSH